MAPKHVQHHHLLARVELDQCPSAREHSQVRRLINEMLQDIDMKKLGSLQRFDVRSRDPERRGSSWLVPIQTSHLSMHFWSHPNHRIMHSDGRCLLQFDLYTCNRLDRRQIQRVLVKLGDLTPTHASITLINRKRGLEIEQHKEWQGRTSWDQFVDDY